MHPLISLYSLHVCGLRKSTHLVEAGEMFLRMLATAALVSALMATLSEFGLCRDVIDKPLVHAHPRIKKSHIRRQQQFGYTALWNGWAPGMDDVVQSLSFISPSHPHRHCADVSIQRISVIAGGMRLPSRS